MMHSNKSAQAAGTQRRFTRAFTLIELIVAIGAISLIAVGIAAIFESIGRTVAGGRRVNQLNQYAALIERQMRSDFEAMTRDGVLVIKHDYADVNGDGFIREPDDLVLNSPTQRADEGRLRRVDQLLFFARGEFTSARAPIVPGFNASSNEARIVYGHGIRLDPIEDVVGRNMGGGVARYDRPQVNDGGPIRSYDDDRALGYSNTGYTTNPNRFAENWTLLREVTLLAQPNSSDLDFPGETADPNFWRDLGLDTRVPALDSDSQIGGQPAAVSAFAHLASTPPEFIGAPTIRMTKGAYQPRLPVTSSGVVDVATTDLAEIRRIIMDAGEYPWNVYDDFTYFKPGDANNLLDDQYNASLNLTDPANNLLHMHAWMQDLFPVIHDPRSSLASAPGIRTRYEEILPDYVGTLDFYSDRAPRRYPFIQNFRLTDQRMLGSAVFVPRCTEFIVEYSFGRTVTDDTSPLFGQLIWHGLRRDMQNTSRSGPAVLPYPFFDDPFNSTIGGVFTYAQPYLKLDGSTATRDLDNILVYGVDATRAQFYNATSLTAHFGYTDPTYSPTDADKDPATVPWAWPKLVRVTMTLADPVDPSLEQTFQFVFETPEGRAF
jgi:type II secretory pathway pseudopilin PulG